MKSLMIIGVAGAQDVSDVLDASYKLKSQSKMELFSEKPKYVYDILESKV
jgi:hypothetical protein